LTVLGIVFFLMGTMLLLYMRSQALSKRDQEIAALRQTLHDIETRGAVYEERLRNKEKREAKLATEPVQFSLLLEKARAGMEGLTVASEEEQPEKELGTSGLKKRAFDFDVREATLEVLISYLTKIESEPKRVILTESLNIRSPSETEDRLIADISLATWERNAAESTEADEGNSKQTNDAKAEAEEEED
jgi:hypothetical protein